MPKSTSPNQKKPSHPSLENPELYPSYTNGVFDPDKYEVEELDRLFDGWDKLKAEKAKAAQGKG